MKKALFLFFTIAVFASSLLAVGPAIWSVDSRAEVMRGDARGVSIDSEGTITLAPRLTEVFKTGQQFIWSSAVDAAGNVYLGTGGDGKVFKVTSSGSGSMLADLAEINVSAIAVAANGDVFAGTSPDGKVYKIDSSGKSEVYFDPKAKYIWSIAALPDGSLAIGTGDGGKLYKVRSANANAEASLLFDTSETHLMSLAADKQGNLYSGTDSSGLVLRFGPDGRPFALLDSPLREVHDLAMGPDGSVYALVLGDSISTPKTDSAATPTSTPSANTVSVDKPSSQPAEQPKSRYDLTNAKTAVYRILNDGSTDLLWASTTVVGFSIEAGTNGVIVGTSDKGRIYSIANNSRDALMLQTDASQISTLISAGGATYATSSNQGSLYRVGGDAAEGTYDSAVLDAKTTASWGRIWWRSSGNVSIQTRSGNTEKPDESWSAWSAAAGDQNGVQIASPRARFFQYRATLRAAGSSLNEVNLSFAARNIAPEVLSIQVLPTNVGLAANPPLQIDPNIILSGMDPVVFGLPNSAVPPRRVYQRGATSLQWMAEDRNGDKLAYDIYYREVGETSYKLLREDLDDNFIAIDGQSLADGRYIFKIVARDTPSNPVSLALAGERITEPIGIDNTAPTVTASGTGQVVGDKGRFVFDASDSSYLTRAEYSLNGGDWKPVYADDGISDGPREKYTIEIPLSAAGEYAVTIRVYDVNANAGNARIVLKR